MRGQPTHSAAVPMTGCSAGGFAPNLTGMTCPNCGARAEGKFCSSCGKPLAGATCASCNAALTPGARFCTQCGKPVRGAAATSPASTLPWVIAGAAMVVAIAVVILPMLRSDGGSSPAPAMNAPFADGGTGQPPPLTGTPLEQANRLFDRIMREQSSGNMEQARFFVPMATQAYQAAEPLDADGLYHLSLVQSVGGDHAGARRTAERVLSTTPTHLLALAAFAEAAAGEGDTAAARNAWRTFLDNLASERAKQLPEYVSHASIFEQYESQARQMVGG